jgi:hypothetical protein
MFDVELRLNRSDDGNWGKERRNLIFGGKEEIRMECQEVMLRRLGLTWQMYDGKSTNSRNHESTPHKFSHSHSRLQQSRALQTFPSANNPVCGQ